MNNTESNHDAMRVFLENMLGEAELARNIGVDVDSKTIVESNIDKIREIAEEGLPLAKLLDASDVVFHAEGPGASHDLPSLSSLNWVTSTIERNLRRLSGNLLDLFSKDGAKLAKKLDFRMSGMAPGSVWVGTKLAQPEPGILEGDESLTETIVGELQRLPQAAAYVDDERVLSSIQEFFPDPALRDASLETLLHFSPTGQKGIHTLGLSAQGHGSARLSQRERVVLRNALKKRMEGNYHKGSFQGEVRGADLDKARFLLKTKDGTLRCVVQDMSADKAREIFGRTVLVHGDYQTDREGRPRLLYVSDIKPVGTSPLDLE